MLEIGGGIIMAAAIAGLVVILIRKRRKHLNRVRSAVEQHSVIGSDILVRM